MTERLFTRGPLLVALIALLVLGGLALWNRQKVAEWSDRAANVATVLGLLVALVGFVLTILTLLDTQQISREAQQETRQAVENIATQLRSADCAALGRWARDLRQAAFDTHWHRALFRAQECQGLARRLSYDRRLHPQETVDLRAGAERLLDIQRFIEKNRMPDSERGLTEVQIRHLDDLIGLLEALGGRLLHQAMG